LKKSEAGGIDKPSAAWHHDFHPGDLSGTGSASTRAELKDRTHALALAR
jgi:hypothetical protein